MPAEAGREPFFCTSFCNQAHRLSDGKPIGHECYVLSVRSLRLELWGLYGRITKMHNNRVHKGVRS